MGPGAPTMPRTWRCPRPPLPETLVDLLTPAALDDDDDPDSASLSRTFLCPCPRRACVQGAARPYDTIRYHLRLHPDYDPRRRRPPPDMTRASPPIIVDQLILQPPEQPGPAVPAPSLPTPIDRADEDIDRSDEDIQTYASDGSLDEEESPGPRTRPAASAHVNEHRTPALLTPVRNPFAFTDASMSRLAEPLYPGSARTVLEFAQARLTVQTAHKVSDAAMEALAQQDRLDLPPGNNVPRHSSMLHLLDVAALGKDLDGRVHMCPNDHVAFVDSKHVPERQYAALEACPVCDAPRYKEDGVTPRKVFHTIPLGPQLATVFGRDDLVAQFRPTLVPPDDPSDGLRRCDDHHKSRAWRERMQQHPAFAEKVRLHLFLRHMWAFISYVGIYIIYGYLYDIWAYHIINWR